MRRRPVTHFSLSQLTVAPLRNLRKVAGRAAWSWSIVLAALLTVQGIVSNGDRATAQVMLYEDRLPDGYAYVRFANATSSSLAMKPVGFADPLTLGTSADDRISPYYVVEKVAGRSLSIAIQPAEHIDFKLTPGAFQTLVIDKSASHLGSQVVTDQLEFSQTKARLSFYNLMSSCAAATLYLEPKGQSVFKDVAPDAMRGRAVNPAADPKVRAACGSANVAALNLGPLDAGGQYSLWLMAPGGRPTAFLSKNKIAPYLR